MSWRDWWIFGPDKGRVSTEDYEEISRLKKQKFAFEQQVGRLTLQLEKERAILKKERASLADARAEVAKLSPITRSKMESRIASLEYALKNTKQLLIEALEKNEELEYRRLRERHNNITTGGY